jgi:hypothetical protein
MLIYMTIISIIRKKNHTDLLGTGNIKENMPNSKELSKQMFSPDRL